MHALRLAHGLEMQRHEAFIAASQTSVRLALDV